MNNKFDLSSFSEKEIAVLLGNKQEDGSHENLNLLEEAFKGVALLYDQEESIGILESNPEISGEEFIQKKNSIFRIFTRIEKQYIDKEKELTQDKFLHIINNEFKIEDKKPGENNSIQAKILIHDPKFVNAFTTKAIRKIFTTNFGIKLEASTANDKIKMSSATSKGKRASSLQQASDVILYFNTEYAKMSEDQKIIRPEDVEQVVVNTIMGTPTVVIDVPAVNSIDPTDAKNFRLVTYKKDIVPQDASQIEAVKALKENKAYTIIGGPQGSGKTFIAAAHAVSELRAGKFKKIILTRATVEAAGENLGFLPGGQKDKIEPYLRPLKDILEEIMGEKELKVAMEENGTVEIAPMAFMRGRTLKDAYIIVDEVQNANDDQIKMVGGRIDKTSRVAFVGDTAQIDLPKGSSGLEKLIDVMQDAKHAVCVRLTGCYRHEAVEELNNRYSEYEARLAENKENIISINKHVQHHANDNRTLSGSFAENMVELAGNTEMFKEYLEFKKFALANG